MDVAALHNEKENWITIDADPRIVMEHRLRQEYTWRIFRSPSPDGCHLFGSVERCIHWHLWEPIAWRFEMYNWLSLETNRAQC